MRYSDTKSLIDHWSSAKTGRGMPMASALRPLELGGMLQRVFMLGRRKDGFLFRLAGEELNAAYGFNLKGRVFADIWAGAGDGIVAAMERAARVSSGVLVDAVVATAWEEIEMETLLLPVTSSDEAFLGDRFIGVQSWDRAKIRWDIGASAIRTVRVTSVGSVTEEGAMFRALERGQEIAALRSVAGPAGSSMRGLRVIQGGRASA